MTKPVLVFIGGMGRSGLGLLRNLLDSHPDVASGPEFEPLHQILDCYDTVKKKISDHRIDTYMSTEDACRLFASLLTDLVAAYGVRKGKRLVIEKTPRNVWYFGDLAELFPGTKFIHLIRDARDIVASHLDVGSQITQRGRSLDPVTQATPQNPFDCACEWQRTIDHGFSVCGWDSLVASSGQNLTLKYEELVYHPETELRRLCAFLEIDFHPSLLSPERSSCDTAIDGIGVTAEQHYWPLSKDRVGRWTQVIPGLRERLFIAAACQRGLASLGYAATSEWIFKGIELSPEEVRATIEAAIAELSAIADSKSKHR
jgi:hypothetical protein